MIDIDTFGAPQGRAWISSCKRRSPSAYGPMSGGPMAQREIDHVASKPSANAKESLINVPFRRVSTVVVQRFCNALPPVPHHTAPTRWFPKINHF
jgi:hypothetical protein